MTLSVLENRFAAGPYARGNDARRHTGRDCSSKRRWGTSRHVAAPSGRSKVNAGGTIVAREVSAAGDPPVEDTSIAIPSAIPFIVCTPSDP